MSCFLARGRWPSGTRAGRARTSSPADQVEGLLAAVIEEARAWTRRFVGLPAAEGVVLEIVHDKPWWASCDYLGGLRSRIAVNADLPMSAIDLLVLAIHETYPGHHTERAIKEHQLVRGRGLLEETLVMSPTPQTIVTEGIAVLAPHLLLGGEGGPTLAGLVHDAGVELDLAHALAVVQAHEPCRWAGVNAALMLHEARSERGRCARVSRALGPGDARVGGPFDPLHDGAGPEDLHLHVLRRPGALPRIRGR